MTERVVLIYDKYENDSGFNFNEGKISNFTKIFPTFPINKDRKLFIYTYGEKVKDGEKCYDKPKCQVIFDLTNFFTKIDKKDIRSIDGRDNIIQNSIISHPRFNDLMERIIYKIEDNNYNLISFVCNHGKHRSVGWAEILKKYYYINSTIKHICIKK